MTIQLKNNATGFLSAGISATATLLVLQSGEGASFPALVPSQFFYVTLVSTSGAIEVVKVTGRSGDSLTVQRAQEGTTAMSFPALSRVELRVTAQAVYDVIDAAISGTTTAVSNIASVIAVAASIDSVNTVTSNLASVINVSNNIGDINLVENSLTNVNAVAANMADVNAVADDLAAVNAVADDIDDLVTNLEDIVAVGGNISSVVTVANNVAGINSLNSNIGVVTTVANDISGANNTGTVATNIAAVQTVSTNIASVNAVNSNSANVNTVAGSIANVNTTATNIASVNTAATNIVAIQTAPAQATAAANSASAAATSATNAANSASAAAASAVTAVNAPGTSGTSTTSLTIGTGSQTLTTQTGKAWVVGQFVTVASTASPTNFMYGQITAYNSGTGSMTVSVLSVGGSGTLASWTIGLGGPNSTLTDQNSLQPVTLTLPSIRPSLLLDFANAKKLDPRITFSRATSGTYYDGVTTAKAEENLLLNSVGPLNSGWSLVDGYAGTLGAELVTNGNFSGGSTGWTLVGSAAVTSGELVMVSGGAGSAYQSTSVGPGFVQVTITKTVLGAAGAGNATMNFRTGVNGPVVGAISIGGADGPRTYKQQVFLTGSATVVEVLYNGAGAYEYKFDDVSVKGLTANNVTAPDGTATAVIATADAANATFTQSVTAVAGDHTFSVWLRRVSGTGNIDITAHSGGTWVTQSITSSWARYTVTQTLTAGTRTPGIHIVTSGDQIEVWGAQFEQRSAATAYTPTTTQPITNYIPQLLTAPAGVPRFDHNPTTGESLGLLVEEQRTNLLTYSADFSNAAWTKSNATIAADTIVAPDGTLTGDKIVSANATAATGVNMSATVAAAAYTATWFVKRAEAQFVQALWSGGVSVNYANFDLINGTVTAGTYTSASITSVGNGWYRVSITSTLASGTGGAFLWLVDTGTAGRGASYTGNGWNGVYLWGAQLEAGSFPTSYIPTTSASVTRTADDASMTGVNFSSWYRANEGTLYGEHTPIGTYNSSSSGVAEADNSAITQSTQVILGYTGLLTGGISYKSALSYSLSASPVAYQNGLTSTAIADKADKANRLVFAVGAAYYRQTTYIRKFAYYPARLTNAQLQALTA